MIDLRLFGLFYYSISAHTYSTSLNGDNDLDLALFWAACYLQVSPAI
jgi:hypothetical protein